MAELDLRERGQAVRALFGRIASRYDLLNRLISLGQDRRWRREAARRLALEPGERALDLGAGTGDLAREMLRHQPAADVIAVDFSLEMMGQGRQRQAPAPSWLLADALYLPFADGSFAAVASAFLLRNAADLDRCLREQARVLRSGGRLVSLETTPHEGPLKPLIKLYLNVIVPALGALIAGDHEAYRYLSASTKGFHHPEALAVHLEQAGLREVGFERKMLRTVAIHWAEKN